MSELQKFWLDWGVQVFVGVATAVVACTAVFGDYLRSKLIKLSIAIDSVYGTDQSYLKTLMHAGQIIGQSMPKAARYYRLRVQNDGRFFPAQRTDVWLLQIDRDENGHSVTIRCELPLIWQHKDFLPGPRTIREHPVFADLFAISEEGSLTLQVLSAPVGFPSQISGACELWLTVQARGAEKSSPAYRIHVGWDGAWKADPEQMNVKFEILGTD